MGGKLGSFCFSELPSPARKKKPRRQAVAREQLGISELHAFQSQAVEALQAGRNVPRLPGFRRSSGAIQREYRIQGGSGAIQSHYWIQGGSGAIH